jgi:FKBP-type peptidyl-prolyl cis-trans isomerase
MPTVRIGLLLLFVLVLTLVIVGCKGDKDVPTKATGPGPTKVTGPGTTLADGLQYWDMKVGSGDIAAPGKMVSVHYTGWLTDGTKFDSSRDRGQPFSFILGTRQVIRGWDEGVAGMKVGGQRQLKIPPALGYGASGVGPIPPNSVLVFDVELLDVK